MNIWNHIKMAYRVLISPTETEIQQDTCNHSNIFMKWGSVNWLILAQLIFPDFTQQTHSWNCQNCNLICNQYFGQNALHANLRFYHWIFWKLAASCIKAIFQFKKRNDVNQHVCMSVENNFVYLTICTNVFSETY